MKSRAAFFLRWAVPALALALPVAAARAQDFRSSGKSAPSLPSSSSRGAGAGADAGGVTNGFDGGAGAAGGAEAALVPVKTGPVVVYAAGPGAASPEGVVIAASSASLTRGGEAWTPVMGEFHFSRYPAAEWRGELLKMKAGGIDIVSTYVFWIHHEEVEGKFTWGGGRDLRRFVQTCAEVGLQVIVRIGPWCHGEARNGGFPDWLVAGGSRLRSDDPRYLDKVRVWFGEIGAQLRGLLWKDGGPVVGAQLENEFRGPAEHLLALKKMAIAAGIVVPLYTRTGWPALASPLPAGEITPVYSVYAEGFWDREITPMPGNYWQGFRFTLSRTQEGIEKELQGRAPAPAAAGADPPDAAAYPYLTAEIGAGMMSAYHRRIAIDPRDVESTALVKLGSGSVMPGYYMYHGGVNPDSVAGAGAPGVSLAENQSTAFTNWNDLPVKNYDFQAPLGAAGQARAQFHLLRRQNMFMHDFGHLLAGMPAVLPARRPDGKNDNTTLRWVLRSNGRGGFIFVNNYQRGQSMPLHRGVQFALNLPPLESVSPLPGGMGLAGDASLASAEPNAARRAAVANAGSKRMVPVAPVDIPPGAMFIWPFNLDLGNGAILAYSTAQLLCRVDTPDDRQRTYFFSEVPGIAPELAFSDITVRMVNNLSGRQRKGDGLVRITNLKTGHAPAITLRSRDGKSISIVVLSYADSLRLYKTEWGDMECVFLAPNPDALPVVDTDGTLRVFTPTPAPVEVLIYPKPDPKAKDGKTARFGRGLLWFLTGIETGGGIFAKLAVPAAAPASKLDAPRVEKIRDAGPPRAILPGKAPKPVPAAPADADFAAGAAIWKITLPPATPPAALAPALADANALLRLHYTGDVARVLLDGKLIMDDFHNGAPLDVPLARYADKLASGAQLTVEILPLRKAAPILLPDGAWPRFGARAAVAELMKAEIVREFTHTLAPKAPDDKTGENNPDTARPSMR